MDGGTYSQKDRFQHKRAGSRSRYHNYRPKSLLPLASISPVGILRRDHATQLHQLACLFNRGSSQRSTKQWMLWLQHLWLRSVPETFTIPAQITPPEISNAYIVPKRALVPLLNSLEQRIVVLHNNLVDLANNGCRGYDHCTNDQNSQVTDGETYQVHHSYGQHSRNTYDEYDAATEERKGVDHGLEMGIPFIPLDHSFNIHACKGALLNTTTPISEGITSYSTPSARLPDPILLPTPVSLRNLNIEEVPGLLGGECRQSSRRHSYTSCLVQITENDEGIVLSNVKQASPKPRSSILGASDPFDRDTEDLDTSPGPRAEHEKSVDRLNMKDASQTLSEQS